MDHWNANNDFAISIIIARYEYEIFLYYCIDISLMDLWPVMLDSIPSVFPPSTVLELICTGFVKPKSSTPVLHNSAAARLAKTLADTLVAGPGLSLEVNMVRFWLLL